MPADTLTGEGDTPEQVTGTATEAGTENEPTVEAGATDEAVEAGTEDEPSVEAGTEDEPAEKAAPEKDPHTSIEFEDLGPTDAEEKTKKDK